MSEAYPWLFADWLLLCSWGLGKGKLPPQGTKSVQAIMAGGIVLGILHRREMLCRNTDKVAFPRCHGRQLIFQSHCVRAYQLL
jgi:hypothetical protein